MSATQPFSWTALLSKPWRSGRTWLTRVPIDDGVDRRNAPMLQIVLIVIGFVPPLLWLYRVLASHLPWRPGESASLLMSLSLSAIAIASLVLIRRGRFQWAARQLLAVVAVLVILSYADSGFAKQAYEQPVQVVWIVLAGLIVGRRALWGMYLCHVVAFAVGLVMDLGGSTGNTDPWMNQIVSALISALILLLIAVVVDRSVAALRESLGEATRRGDELGQVNLRLQAEIAERESVREQLVHAQKVEAVGRLAAGVAHDFNHLLSLVLGHARRGRNVDDAGELKAALLGVEAAALRAAAVAQTLLNFSRQDATRTEIFDAGEVLSEMRPMLLQLFDDGVRLSIEVPATPCLIAFDRAHFALIVLNIAANANHAMPDGGQFRVVVRAAPRSQVEMEFADSGHGMTRDMQQRIFEPFFTTKPSGQGTGLGLAVAANLVEGAGGELTVRSEPAQGATFRILLPSATSLDAPTARVSADIA